MLQLEVDSFKFLSLPWNPVDARYHMELSIRTIPQSAICTRLLTPVSNSRVLQYKVTLQYLWHVSICKAKYSRLPTIYLYFSHILQPFFLLNRINDSFYFFLVSTGNNEVISATIIIGTWF